MRGVSALIQEVTFSTHGNHGSHGVEEVREHQGEDQQDHRDGAELAKSPNEVNLEQGVEGRNRDGRTAQGGNSLSPAGRRGLTLRGKVEDCLQDDGQDGRGEQADQHCALYLADIQDDGDNQAENEDQSWPAIERAIDAKLNRG